MGWRLMALGSLCGNGAVLKDRNRRTCPDFTSGAKRDLRQKFAEKYVDFQSTVV